MSIKIWDAYRLPKSGLNEFLALVRGATLEVFYKNLDERINFINDDKVIESVDRTEASLISNLGTLPDWYDRERCTDRNRWGMLEEKLIEASRGSLKSYFDLDASFNIWLDRRYAYVIPYGRVKIPSLDWVTDYHYQNQTDRPDDISGKQWAARSKKWHELCLDDWDATRLQYVIIEFSSIFPRSKYMAEKHLLGYK